MAVANLYVDSVFRSSFSVSLEIAQDHDLDEI